MKSCDVSKVKKPIWYSVFWILGKFGGIRKLLVSFDHGVPTRSKNNLTHWTANLTTMVRDEQTNFVHPSQPCWRKRVQPETKMLQRLLQDICHQELPDFDLNLKETLGRHPFQEHTLRLQQQKHVPRLLHYKNITNWVMASLARISLQVLPWLFEHFYDSNHFLNDFQRKDQWYL